MTSDSFPNFLEGKYMEPIRAGESTRVMAATRRKKAILISLFGLILVIILAAILNNYYKLGLGAIGGIGFLVLLLLLKIVPIIIEKKVDTKLKEEKRAIRGAKSEEKVGELLESLSEDYYVIHDLRNPNGNIDHIVIGKTNGIFLIETKAHGGKVTATDGKLLVNGHLPEKDFILQTVRNALWLRDTISNKMGIKPWITPIIVFTNAFVPFMQPVKGIHIINKKYLKEVITKNYHQNPSNLEIWERRSSFREIVEIPD
jgi:hypothetical protein